MMDPTESNVQFLVPGGLERRASGVAVGKFPSAVPDFASTLSPDGFACWGVMAR